MSEGVGIWERLDNLDRRILYWILIILIAIPYLNPLGIPVPVTNPTQGFYNTLSALEPGSAVILDITSGPSAYGEIGAGTAAFMELITGIYPEQNNGQKLKLIVVSSTEQGPIMYDRYALTAFERNNWVYGEDYVFFGYISGFETFVARLAEDIPSLLQTDYKQNDVEDLAVMQGIEDYTDISAVVMWDSGSAVNWWVKQWSPKGVPVGGIFVAVGIPQLEAFLKSGDLYGFIGGSRGSAELEYLIGAPGEAVATTDTLSISHIYVIILIILGNIGYFVRRREGENK